MLSPKTSQQESKSKNLNDYGTGMGLTMAPPAFSLTANPQNGGSQHSNQAPIQKKDPDDDVEANNIIHENPFTRMEVDQQILIDGFANDVHRIAGGWQGLREMHTDGGSEMSDEDYRSDLFELTERMGDRWKEFSGDFIHITRLESGINEEGEMDMFTHQDSIYTYKTAKKELARQLNVGSFPRYLKEMAFFHRAEVGTDLTNYIDLMEKECNMAFDTQPHEYVLETLGGVSGGAGEGVTFGGSIKGFRITYKNDLGMSWKVDLYGGSGKVGAGLSGSPIEANVELSTEFTGVGGATALESRYYSPDYFHWNVVTTHNAEANVSVGKSVGTMAIGDVVFDMGGDVVKFGTSQYGEIGTDLNLGVFRGGEAYDFKGIDSEFEAAEEEAPKIGSMEIYKAVVHFPTEGALLNDEDHETLDDLVNRMAIHQAFWPGDIYHAMVTGYSSPRWKTPDQSAQKYDSDTGEIDHNSALSKEEKDMAKRDQLNQELATARAENVALNLKGKLSSASWSQEDDGLHIDEGMQAVNAASKVKFKTEEVEAGGEDQIRENDPRVRAVSISVRYLNSPLKNLDYKAGKTNSI